MSLSDFRRAARKQLVPYSPLLFARKWLNICFQCLLAYCLILRIHMSHVSLCAGCLLLVCVRTREMFSRFFVLLDGWLSLCPAHLILWKCLLILAVHIRFAIRLCWKQTSLGKVRFSVYRILSRHKLYATATANGRYWQFLLSLLLPPDGKVRTCLLFSLPLKSTVAMREPR